MQCCCPLLHLQSSPAQFYLSDCHFFDFGVQVTENVTEHLVVIIDAGSRGISSDPPWKNSQVNTAVMHKFWTACAKESATNDEIKDMWRYNTQHQCYVKATKADDGKSWIAQAIVLAAELGKSRQV